MVWDTVSWTRCPLLNPVRRTSVQYIHNKSTSASQSTFQALAASVGEHGCSRCSNHRRALHAFASSSSYSLREAFFITFYLESPSGELCTASMYSDLYAAAALQLVSHRHFMPRHRCCLTHVFMLEKPHKNADAAYLPADTSSAARPCLLLFRPPFPVTGTVTPRDGPSIQAERYMSFSARLGPGARLPQHRFCYSWEHTTPPVRG